MLPLFYFVLKLRTCMSFLKLHICYTLYLKNRINKGFAVRKTIKKVRKEIKTTQYSNKEKIPINAVFVGVFFIFTFKLKTAKNG